MNITLEEKILKSFQKLLGKEVEDLDLFVALVEDCWPDYDGVYSCEVMETKDNGKVWELTCTKSGRIKDYIEL